MAETTAWLVEAPGTDNNPAWWDSDGWTSAKNRALRFSRREDAEAFIRSNVSCYNAVARERVFLDAVPRLYGVERASWNPSTVIVTFSDKPTAAQIRHLHEYLRGWSPDKEKTE